MDTDDNNAFPGYSRKRMKKTWKKVEAKKKRNSGEEYVSGHTNAVVPARQIGSSAGVQWRGISRGVRGESLMTRVIKHQAIKRGMSTGGNCPDDGSALKNTVRKQLAEKEFLHYPGSQNTELLYSRTYNSLDTKSGGYTRKRTKISVL
ncbi:hypothetical protein AVEN_71207-1 [Araneus ventricosus]|uniref:Uncharacterized protein n=1 Tax=Araneus ventricosus TaxID=182803 RepID=A0A4Y2UZY8_ARAVE|nr:hypothetical protein AVEN_71207-1 [Araneus ventricosus]